MTKLKGVEFDADEPCMFLRQQEPILLTEEGLDGLCTSLNRPVVDVEGLPVGPASSAIVLHRARDGASCLAVALRAEDSGAVVFFAFQGELNSSRHQAMDAGLAFAEGMGFLFDDDLLASGDADARRQAMDAWCRLTGDEPGPADLGVDLDDEDLLLDEIVDLDEEVPAASDRLPPSKTMLSKFRRPETGEGAAPERRVASPPTTADDRAEGAPAQLGRIPIVRRRRSTDPESETPPLLTRLLARF